MARIQQLEQDQVPSFVKRVYRRIEDSLGYLPNLYKGMANSPETLNGFLELSKNINAGVLEGWMRKAIILAVSEKNGCEYCLSMHTSIALKQGLLSEEQCIKSRKLEGWNDRSTAILNLTGKMLKGHGHLQDSDIEVLAASGFSEAEIVEMVGVIVQITFANYIAELVNPDLDFDPAPPLS